MTAAGWRELRTATDDGAPWASAVEVAIVAEELSRGLADAAFLDPRSPPSCAAWLAPAATAPRPWRSSPTCLCPAVAAEEGCRRHAVAIDAAGATSALVLVAGGARRRPRRSGAPQGVHTLASVELGGPGVTVDLTRPAVALDSSTGVSPRRRGRPWCWPPTG